MSNEEHVSIEIKDVSNIKITAPSTPTTTPYHTLDISNTKMTRRLTKKLSVFKKFQHYLMKKETHDKKRGFDKWKKNTDLKGKPSLLLHKELKKCSDIEEVSYDFDYAHSITANGNYYNYVSYFDVEKSIKKMYYDTSEYYSYAMDILATYVRGQKLIYMESKFYCEKIELSYVPRYLSLIINICINVCC